MVAGKFDTYMEQGADWTWSVEWPDTSVDLTGCSARLQARVSLESTSTILNLSSTSTGITISVPNRKITISVPASITSTITDLTSLYDLELVGSGGSVERLLEGKITLSKEITR